MDKAEHHRKFVEYQSALIIYFDKELSKAEADEDYTKCCMIRDKIIEIDNTKEYDDEDNN